MFLPIVLAALVGLAAMLVLDRARDADGALRFWPTSLGLGAVVGVALVAAVGLEPAGAMAEAAGRSVMDALNARSVPQIGFAPWLFTNGVAALLLAGVLATRRIAFGQAGRRGRTLERSTLLLGLFGLNLLCLLVGAEQVAAGLGW